ncbi:MAG: alpha/beta hydrolase [Acidimicrobiales bacterium]|nr:alpha/beta hydrolase [Acidimicrobiales bacterium]
MPEVSANGLRFHVQVLRGAGSDGRARPQVVMLHGLVIDNLSSWYYTLAHPLALVADVHLYDLRGHGRSQMPANGYSVADHVDDLVALLDGWGITEPVHLFGNSFGGVVALALAHRHPERVASLFLIEAHFAVEGWGEHMAGSLALAAFGLDEDAVQDWLRDNGDRKLSRMARRSERFLTETSLIDDLQAEAPIAWLTEITAPTYAMYGSDSDIGDRARELEAKVTGCTLEIVEGSSHSLLTERSALVRERALAWVHGQSGPEMGPAGRGSGPVNSSGDRRGGWEEE